MNWTKAIDMRIHAVWPESTAVMGLWSWRTDVRSGPNLPQVQRRGFGFGLGLGLGGGGGGGRGCGRGGGSGGGNVSGGWSGKGSRSGSRSGSGNGSGRGKGGRGSETGWEASDAWDLAGIQVCRAKS